MESERSTRFTPNSWERTPLVIARRTDEGKLGKTMMFWKMIPRGFCYIAMFFTEDDSLLQDSLQRRK